MKATDLILALESVIENHGDMEVALSNNIDKNAHILFGVNYFDKDAYAAYRINDFLKSSPFVLLTPHRDRKMKKVIFYVQAYFQESPCSPPKTERMGFNQEFQTYEEAEAFINYAEKPDYWQWVEYSIVKTWKPLNN